jgi:broad specificity phosphatase PhoE
MQLLLIRHGQSRANIEQVIQGDDDPLTDLGRLQADMLGRYLASTHVITALYASPLERARETALIVGRHIGREPIFEPGLAEMCAGSAAGMTWEAWSEAFPEQSARLRARARSLDDRWEGGESGLEFMTRVLAAYDRIVEQHRASDDTIAVVSHGGALAWIASKVFGDPADVWPFERAIFANCSISELLIDADGAHAIGIWNHQEHLLQDR